MKVLSNQKQLDIMLTLYEAYTELYEKVNLIPDEKEAEKARSLLFGLMWDIGHAIDVWKGLGGMITDFFNRPEDLTRLERAQLAALKGLPTTYHGRTVDNVEQNLESIIKYHKKKA